MDRKRLKKKLFNAISMAVDEFICETQNTTDEINGVINDLKNIDNNWATIFHKITFEILSCLIFKKNKADILVETAKKSALTYEVILKIITSNNYTNKLVLRLEFWKHHPENVYVGNNEGMIKYDIIMNDDIKISGNTSLESYSTDIVDNTLKIAKKYNEEFGE